MHSRILRVSPYCLLSRCQSDIYCALLIFTVRLRDLDRQCNGISCRIVLELFLKSFHSVYR